MPALAVADALRVRGADVSFIGVRGTGASGVVREAGYREDAIPLRGFARRVTLRNLWALWLAALATPAPRACWCAGTPDVVVGRGRLRRRPGGAGRLAHRRPLLLMEADSHLGDGEPHRRAAGEAGHPGLPARRPLRAAATW